MPKLYHGDPDDEGKYSSISDRYSGDLGEALRYENATETIRRLQYEMQMWKSGKSQTSDEDDKTDSVRGQTEQHSDRSSRREQEKRAAYAKIQETRRRAQAMREKISTIRSSMSPSVPPQLSSSLLSDSGNRHVDEANGSRSARPRGALPSEHEQYSVDERLRGQDSYRPGLTSKSPEPESRREAFDDTDSIHNYLKPRKERNNSDRDDRPRASRPVHEVQNSSKQRRNDSSHHEAEYQHKEMASSLERRPPVQSDNENFQTADRFRKPPISPEPGKGGRRSMSPK
eukprot:766462-Hanusia_phi.AAC.1